MQNRNDQIDILRGIGIIAMILIHVTAWYKTDALAFYFWNSSQFAVQVFNFCSGYLFFLKEQRREGVFSLKYFAKRATRLLIPYYVFLVFYLPLEIIESPKRLSLNYILKSFTLTGGPDLNWIILLFLMLALLMPFLLYLLRSRKLFFFTYVLLAAFSSLLFLNLELRTYKLIMWLPWSLIILASWLFVKFHNRITSAYLAISCTVTALLLSFYLSVQDHSLLLIDNKYPPNLYYLLYGVAWISGHWFVLSFLDLKKKAWNIVRFFSVNSYSIFFIHFWVFTFMRVVLKLDLHWGYLFVIVLMSSVLVQKIINFLSKVLHSKLYAER